MKIFVNARFLTQPISGVQRYGIECSRQIKKLYPDVCFIAPKNILHKDIEKELKVTIVGNNTGHLWEQVDLPVYLVRNKCPALLNPANTGPLFYNNNFITIHDLAFYHHPEWNSKKFSAWYNILVPRLAHGSRHIFTVSNTIREEIIKFYRIAPAKISVAYNGISEKMLDLGRPFCDSKEKIILSVGTFNIRKNHQQLIAAYLASDIHKEYTLVLIGDKNKVFKDSGIDENMLVDANIKIYPSLTENELIAMYQKAEILVSLSLYEGFGIPVLEGLYNGCKVICSDIPVYRELFEKYVTFCKPGDFDNIVNSINAVVKEKPVSQEDINELTGRYNYSKSAKIILRCMQVV